MDFPVESLKYWFLSTRRDLPWRDHPTPYEVWVSEMMLQQTQVSYVLPFYLQWMRLFPTIYDLANSPVEKVLKAWEGLGYYKRAHYLHQGAKQIIKEWDGLIPNDENRLAKIKGLGAYTIAALLSFAFKKKIAPVDGNVTRVFARYFLIEEPVEKSSIKNFIQEKANAILPEDEPWLISEALIELGALVCRKKPICTLCPLKQGCLAYRFVKQEEIPKKKKSISPIFLHRHVGVIQFHDKILIQKGGKEGALLGDLFEFPHMDGESFFLSKERAQAYFENILSIKLKFICLLPQEKQTFTRYRVHLYPYYFKVDHQIEREDYILDSLDNAILKPFSSGHKRIFLKFLNEIKTNDL